MRKLGIVTALAASLAVSACATYPDRYGRDSYGYDGYGNPAGPNGNYDNGYYGNGDSRDSRTGNVVTGAVVGATAGAVAGAILPGIRPGTGAVAGAVLGGVLGATVNGRQYYRDTRGYCYYVDQYGQPRYRYDIRC